MARLMTAEQVASEFGLPSARTVRTMRADGLAAVRLGKAYLFDVDDVQAFIQSRKETKCRDRIEVHISPSSGIGAAGTSNGAKLAAPGSTAQALTIAQRLKSHSPSSSRKGSAPLDPPGRVIPLNSRSTKR
ncbi:hypothetical protein G432_09320 [Sphingomonas sp. MM-1]|nr:hypothetical protein G432_09320 [Sphingomonas sp. MM-1]